MIKLAIKEIEINAQTPTNVRFVAISWSIQQSTLDYSWRILGTQFAGIAVTSGSSVSANSEIDARGGLPKNG